MESLKRKGIDAAAFPADATNTKSIRAAIGQARAALGPITVLHWNASSGHEIADLMTASPALVRGVFDVGVLGLLTAVQETFADLKLTKGAVLVTNGILGDLTAETDQFAVRMKVTGVALANAAKYKLVGVLSAQLESYGVYVGEIVVAAMVMGTPWDSGNASLARATVADGFWELYTARKETRARVG